ncbi:MAG: hypothetical protein JWO32_1595 [Bacteroidetes bacterium]|nr:hypothetical protein [Bacteroidota bacterium]
MNSTLKKTFVWTCLFAIAMGFMESSIVIYLRELFYKNGFNFPLKGIPPFIARIEFFRELGTVIMLVGIGIIAGKTKLQRFAYFVLAFAIWDIFYYIFLYLCLGWPPSLCTWDILFLIPVPWVGPVWAPCLLCMLMITGSVFVIIRSEENREFKIAKIFWWMLIAGAAVCILSFMWDYLIFSNTKHQTWSVLSNQDLFPEIENYIPIQFNYFLFFTGFLAMCTAVIFSMIKPFKKLSN